MQKLEGQVETTVEILGEAPARQRYARPTVETLDVGMTRFKPINTPETVDPTFGS